ncbi:MAG: HNH endonuclease [Thiolinea sp.]
MNILERAYVEKLALNHGWENIITSDERAVIAGSARHHAQVTITQPSSQESRITFNKILLTKELLRDFTCIGNNIFSVTTTGQLANLLRRAAELAFALPNQAVETFHTRLQQELAGIGDIGTEVERLVKQRIGQNTFREALMDYWEGACAVTGITVPEMLRASHAKPWAECGSDEERLNVFNGFLLSANLDALFDRGLISFDANGKILISNQIPAQQRQLIGLTDQMKLRWLAPEHSPFLEWHHGILRDIKPDQNPA